VTKNWKCKGKKWALFLIKDITCILINHNQNIIFLKFCYYFLLKNQDIFNKYIKKKGNSLSRYLRGYIMRFFLIQVKDTSSSSKNDRIKNSDLRFSKTNIVVIDNNFVKP